MRKIYSISFLLTIIILLSCSKDEPIELTTQISKDEPIELTTQINFSFDTYDTQIPAKIGHEAIFFNNYFWIMGGSAPFSKITKNDLWRSSDGIDWEKVCEHTEWDGREFFNLFTFENKLWIIGGESTRNSEGNEYVGSYSELDRLSWKGDVWTSENGLDWVKVIEYGPWQTRTSGAVAVFNNKIILIGGQSTTNWHVYQDIYESTNGKDWVRIGEIKEEIIGTKENREGLTEHDLIQFNNKLFLLGGSRASAFNLFNWILESSDGHEWTIATQTPYWKDNDSCLDMRFVRPFVFKNILWAIIGNELLYSKDGINWIKKMDLPLFNNRELMNPRIIVKDQSIYIYGSYCSIYGVRDTQVHLIKLDIK